MGRPAFTPTDEQRLTVSIMAACGMPHELICERILNPQTGARIDAKTLRQAFRKELDEGTASANAMVAQALFKKATGNTPQAVTAAIFWLKTRAGWKEPASTEEPGRKELRQEAAEKVAGAGRFAPTKAPKLVVSNK